MWLKACRECGHPVERGVWTCPRCGEPVAQRSKLIWVGVAAVTGAVLALLLVPILQRKRRKGALNGA